MQLRRGRQKASKEAERSPVRPDEAWGGSGMIDFGYACAVLTKLLVELLKEARS
jgi:hypothetical protein